MSLLIDGYNLLTTVGILARGVGPGSLERARLAMLNFLAESLDAEEIAHTTVVFDAGDSTVGLPRTTDHRGLTVCFATGYEDADTMIEELILTDSAPRRLTVVSSDNRLKRAARRRKAIAVDSETWYETIVHRRQQRRQTVEPSAARPPAPLLAEDIEYWIRQFGGESLLTKFIEQESADPAATEEKAADNEPPAEETAADKPGPDEAAEIGNPFPPGYAEDLLKDDLDDTNP